MRPPRCARCGAPTAWPVDRCRECSGRRLGFVSARSAVEYAGPAQAFVRAWKERGLRHLAACAAELVVEHVERPAADLITYVPSDPIRQLDRGRHPAESLARELGARWALDLVSLLERGRVAERQATLPYAARGSNVRGAFTARRPPAGKVVGTSVVGASAVD